MAIILSFPFTDEPISAATFSTVYSAEISNRLGGGMGIELQFTGTPTSVITLQKSNVEKVDDNTAWLDDGDVTFTGPSGGVAHIEEEVGNVRFRWYRFKVVTSSGTGTVTARVTNTAS